MKREREPTSEELEKLLAWLDADREVAGAKHEVLRSRLMRLFVNRGGADEARLADEVINRVAVRIDTLVQTYDNPTKCLLGFANKVAKEYLRVQRELQLSTEAMPHPPAPDVDDQKRLELEDDCLARCLADLSKSENELFRRYFQEEKRKKIKPRSRLAAELGLTANALRIKSYRIRRRLRRCMEICLGNPRSPETN